jgi:NADH-quinone oxidoreductase subunit J
MALTHKERQTPRRHQPELSVERIMSTHPTPLPTPGVYAEHNAVDTPALLPDGTASDASVPEQLRRQGVLRYAELDEARQAQDDGGDQE